jgi:hypothetical protein
MAKTDKVLVGFNVSNGKYAIKTNGAYGSPVDLGYLTRFSKEKNLTSKTIYGDGEIQTVLVNDKGFTGTLGLLQQDLEFNKALGFMLDTDNGTIEMQQSSVVECAIYFETEFMKNDGIKKTKKVWVVGVNVEAPSESLEQTTDDINENNVEYSITVKGEYLKNSAGTDDYTDGTTGQKVKYFTFSKTPSDTGYSTFGDSVPIAKYTISSTSVTPAQE